MPQTIPKSSPCLWYGWYEPSPKWVCIYIYIYQRGHEIPMNYHKWAVTRPLGMCGRAPGSPMAQEYQLVMHLQRPSATLDDFCLPPKLAEPRKSKERLLWRCLEYSSWVFMLFEISKSFKFWTRWTHERPYLWISAVWEVPATEDIDLQQTQKILIKIEVRIEEFFEIKPPPRVLQSLRSESTHGQVPCLAACMKRKVDRPERTLPLRWACCDEVISH